MRDQLAEQRRQLSEIERIRSLAGSGSRSTSSGTRSHAVMPPSGAERPANHLQVNKIAQVPNCWSNYKYVLSTFLVDFL